MQYLLEKGPQQEKEELCEYLKNNFVVLSMNKFARYFIDFCFKIISPS